MAQSSKKTEIQALDQHRQFLTFRSGDELFSVGIDCVKEIMGYGEVTAVPAMPPQFRGVINLRGQAVPVVDLAAWFARGTSPVTRRTCIVIIELDQQLDMTGHSYVGVMVDSVSEVLEIKAADIQPPPGFGTTIRADFIEGLGHVNDKFIMILDIANLLSAEAMSALPVVTASASAV